MTSQHDKHIELAKRHVIEGEQRVARQEILVEELMRDGHDTTMAHEILATFIESLALARQSLQRLLDSQI